MRNQQGVEVMGDGPEEEEGVDIAHRGELLDWIFLWGIVCGDSICRAPNFDLKGIVDGMLRKQDEVATPAGTGKFMSED